MNPVDLVAHAAHAVRSTKYRTQGVVNGQRRDMPPSMADRRYAVAASSLLLRELAAHARKAGPIPSYVLDRLANEMEREEPPR